MKKVVIFGATGNTGLCALEHAVKKGIFLKLKTTNYSNFLLYYLMQNKMNLQVMDLRRYKLYKLLINHINKYQILNLLSFDL